jgi:predicted transcriptional regulator
MANLTIKVDDETLRRARIKALQEGTSVSRVLANYLDHFVEGDLQQSGWAAFLASARSTTAASEHGRDWTRDELYRG